MTEHRVASHLGVEAETYDAAIRRWIPGYAQMVAQICSIIDEATGPAPLVVDLGTGTGALASAILDAVPRARAILVDIDPAMLEVAAARVAKHGARAEIRRASFVDPLPACDAVVASLALHHLPVLDDKRALYARIYAALRPGGVFLLGDATTHESGPERDRVYREWERAMAQHGISRDEAVDLFAQWAREDRYYPLAVELEALRAAGFPRPDAFWKQSAITVYGGFKR